MFSNRYVRFALQSSLLITGYFIGAKVAPEVKDIYERFKDSTLPKSQIVEPYYENAKHIVQFVYNAQSKK